MIALPRITRVITLEQMARIAGEGIHSDHKKAEALGLGGAIAQTGQLLGYLSDMMVRALGHGFLTGGEIAVSFIHPVRPGDTIVTGGEITETDGQHVTCAIWLENQRGEKVTVGTASGFLT